MAALAPNRRRQLTLPGQTPLYQPRLLGVRVDNSHVKN